MPLKPELNDFLNRASSALYGVMGVCGDCVQNLAAIQRLSEDATDETAKAIVEKARTRSKDAMSTFLATDFDTVDLDTLPSAVETP